MEENQLVIIQNHQKVSSKSLGIIAYNYFPVTCVGFILYEAVYWSDFLINGTTFHIFMQYMNNIFVLAIVDFSGTNVLFCVICIF